MNEMWEWRIHTCGTTTGAGRTLIFCTLTAAGLTTCVTVCWTFCTCGTWLSVKSLSSSSSIWTFAPAELELAGYWAWTAGVYAGAEAYKSF